MKINRLLTCSACLILFLLVMGLPASNLSAFSLPSKDSFSYYFPVIAQYHQPLSSTSYYLTTVEATYLYDLGCALGARDNDTPGVQDSVVVLDFSFPICNADGSFGADLFSNDPISLSQVGDAVRQFAQGYYHCSGSDTDSNLVIGVGTNNKPNSCKTRDQAIEHGHAWAEMVSQINDQMLTDGIFHQVQAYGASDMELGWNTPQWTRAWLAGFERTGENFVLHFGDAAGCPYEGNPHYRCGTSRFPEWTLEDVWFVSWGSPSALPLPLIYLTNGVHAKQWAYLSQYSVRQHGHRMDFTGVFTQSQYCDQFTWCKETDNTPFEAYVQLETELGKNPETKQHPRWKTDILWILSSETFPIRVPDENAPGASPRHPVYLEIDKLETSLAEGSLSPLMKESLQTKLQIYRLIAEKLETSKENPAPK